MKKLSIVIPVFNIWKITARCVASILKSSFPKEELEIVIIDNHSTDKTEDFLKYLQSQGEPIRIIRNETNFGYLLGANQGWETVKTDFLLHMNNDVILDKDCIKILMETFETNPKIGVVGAVQFFEGGGRNKPLSFFHRGEDDVGNVYKREVTTEEENSLFVEADIGGGFGCAMLKKEVWEKVGYYDTQFSPAMYEQEDFCLRAKEAGFKVGLAPKAHCVHLVAQTTSFNPSYFQKVIDINREKFRAKWGQKLRENKI